MWQRRWLLATMAAKRHKCHRHRHQLLTRPTVAASELRHNILLEKAYKYGSILDVDRLATCTMVHASPSAGARSYDDYLGNDAETSVLTGPSLPEV